MKDMKVTIMLADFAQALNGKLYIMGGGWSITGPMPSPSAIAIKIEVPWTETNQKHNLKIELLDGDYHPVLIPMPAGNSPLVISGEFEVGRPAGLKVGTSIDAPFAFNIGPLSLEPGKGYVWKLSIDDKTNENWQVSFSTRPSHQSPAKT
ncbi:MAG: hypothetical protein HY747_05070 [Elusimicrobia bacterium]|nr:hypothetical protein [Elusimicrobiota bacterium]